MGYIPDWQRQSAAKNQSQSKPTTTPSRIISKPIFHAEKALHSQGTQTPFTRHYADGGDVEYNETDKGLLGGEIKYRTDDQGRKFVPTKDPMSGRTSENRYYSVDDVKEGFKSLFSSKSKPTETLSAPTKSSSDEAEKAANMGTPAKTAMQTANESSSNKGVFSAVDEAVKSATKASEGGGPTSTTDYSTKTRSNSSGRVAAPTGGRKDIPGSDAMSFPLKSDTGSIGNQTFPVDKSVGVANEDRPSKPYPTDTRARAGAKLADSEPAARTRAGTIVKEDPPTESKIPKNTFLTRQRMDDADRAMYAARKSSSGIARTRAGTAVK